MIRPRLTLCKPGFNEMDPLSLEYSKEILFKEDHLMSSIKLLGIDFGKSNFHLVGLDVTESTVYRKKLSRPKLIEFITQLEPCTFAFEACGGSHWLARKCKQLGHRVKSIPPQYAKPYVKGNKNDFIDAAAIAEASGPTRYAFRSDIIRICTIDCRLPSHTRRVCRQTNGLYVSHRRNAIRVWFSTTDRA